MSSATLSLFQKGWNFGEDGPGNRLIYHLEGCNLHCPWCSNPEGMEAGTLIVNAAKLTPAVCPHGAITDTLDRTLCARCTGKECVSRNRNEGIRLSASPCRIDALVQEVLSAKSLFHGGGGVTLSGGEPTMQFDGTRTFLKALHSQDIDTAMETNGTHARLPELFPFIDTLIIDMKHHDDAVASAVTGTSMRQVRANIAAATENDVSLIVRITLIPGFNSTMDDIRRFASLAPMFGANTRVEFLVYHEYGAVKWQQCGKTYHPASGDTLSIPQAEAIFREHGMNMAGTSGPANHARTNR
ncbi:MAG: radical SAM protein [Spirochaetota bacterium]